MEYIKPIQAFLEAAEYFLGITSLSSERGKEMLRTAGYPNYNDAWCAVFVSACAVKAGLSNNDDGSINVIARGTAANGPASNTVSWYNGKWIDGPAINGGYLVTPQPGDIITFAWTAKYKGHYHASHVGIVEKVEGGRVHTFEGNTGGKSKRNSYDLSYTCINTYVRPDWSRASKNVGSNLSQYVLGSLYQTKNDRHDMTLRQFGYIGNNYQLSDDPSSLHVSAINYTSILGEIYNTFAPASLSATQVDTSQLDGNIKIAMDYLLSMGYSASAASAYVGCIKTYSGVEPTYSKELANKKYLNGICAWDENELPKVKDKLGYEWNINLSGQLEYFNDDLVANYKELLVLTKNLSLSEKSIQGACDKIMVTYNKHYILTDYMNQSKENALEIYSKLVITQGVIAGSVTNIRNSSGELLTPQKSRSIPSSVSQTGLIDDYTSYSAYFPGNAAVKSHWAKGTTQQELAYKWRDQGFPCNKGIAMIGGYFCVAVVDTFAQCGDVIVVNAEDNISFSAIVCDTKNQKDQNCNEWGHIKYSNKVSVIEWQRVKTNNGKVEVEWSGYSDVDSCQLGNWYGKKVLNIINYGPYLK